MRGKVNYLFTLVLSSISRSFKNKGRSNKMKFHFTFFFLFLFDLLTKNKTK